HGTAVWRRSSCDTGRFCWRRRWVRPRGVAWRSRGGHSKSRARALTAPPTPREGTDRTRAASRLRRHSRTRPVRRHQNFQDESAAEPSVATLLFAFVTVPAWLVRQTIRHRREARRKEFSRRP